MKILSQMTTEEYMEDAISRMTAELHNSIYDLEKALNNEPRLTILIGRIKELSNQIKIMTVDLRTYRSEQQEKF